MLGKKLEFTGKNAKVKKLFVFLVFLMHYFKRNKKNGVKKVKREDIKKITISGKHEWRDSNGQSYLYVEADTPHDLGYHTGKALASKIVLMKSLLLTSSIIYHIRYSKMIEMGMEYLDYIPEKYLIEIAGISEGATVGSGFNISFEDVLVQALFFEIIYGRHNPVSDVNFGCTSIGAKNTDSAIIGQNIDVFKPMGWVSAFVLHKLKNEPSVFTYRLGGSPALPMGKNEYGVTLNLNLVQTKVKASLTTPSFVLVREGLANAKTAEHFYDIFFSNDNWPFGLNLLIADDKDIIGVQSHPEKHIKTMPPSIIVHSNTFIIPAFQNKLVDKNYSKERQRYAEELVVEKCNGHHLTEIQLLDILGDKPIICRNEGKLMAMATMAFLTTNFFGLGTTNEKIGSNPI